MIDKSPVTQVAEDIYKVRIPLPFALNHVNCYLLRGAEGWTLIDTGINWKQSQQAWKDAMNTLGFSPGDLEQIVLTHIHPDHFGLVGWWLDLAHEAGNHPPVILSDIEASQFDYIWREADKHGFALHQRRGGVTQDILQAVADSFQATLEMTYPHPKQFLEILHSDSIKLGDRSFDVILTPGHSDGHIIFYDADDKLMLSGDHVLMHITPNIGSWTMTAPNPLGRFMNSLQTLQAYDVRLALPGHKWLIEDWRGRLQELLVHHEHRLQLTLETVESGADTGYTVAQSVFAPTDRFTVHEWRFAVAETLAHLDYLVAQGKLKREGDEVWRYSLV